jgi:hypothetical protein
MLVGCHKIVLISWIALAFINGLTDSRHIAKSLDENLLNKQQELNYIMEKLQGNTLYMVRHREHRRSLKTRTRFYSITDVCMIDNLS